MYLCLRVDFKVPRRSRNPKRIKDFPLFGRQFGALVDIAVFEEKYPRWIRSISFRNVFHVSPVSTSTMSTRSKASQLSKICARMRSFSRWNMGRISNVLLSVRKATYRTTSFGNLSTTYTNILSILLSLLKS